MTRAESLEVLENYVNFLDEDITEDIELAENPLEAFYHVEALVVAPLDDNTAMVVFGDLYNRRRNFDDALNPFITQLNLFPALYVRVLAEGTYTFIPVG